MEGFVDAVYVMAYRQVKRFLRAPSRIVSSVVNPVIWIVFFGLGWAAAFKFPQAREIFGGLGYLSYLVPGVVAMAVFSGSFLSGISVIFDKQFGFLKEVLVAPAPRSAVVLGRIVGDSLTAMLQAAVIAVLGAPLVSGIRLWGLAPALGYSYRVAMGFSAAGIALASRITSHEGFQMIMSFLMLPLIFLSGAFYPIRYMPEWMKALAYADPLTYGVDAIRYWMTGVSQFSPLLDLAALAALDAVLVAVAVALFNRSTLD